MSEPIGLGKLLHVIGVILWSVVMQCVEPPVCRIGIPKVLPDLRAVMAAEEVVEESLITLG